VAGGSNVNSVMIVDLLWFSTRRDTVIASSLHVAVCRAPDIGLAATDRTWGNRLNFDPAQLTSGRCLSAGREGSET